MVAVDRLLLAKLAVLLVVLARLLVQDRRVRPPWIVARLAVAVAAASKQPT